VLLVLLVLRVIGVVGVVGGLFLLERRGLAVALAGSNVAVLAGLRGVAVIGVAVGVGLVAGGVHRRRLRLDGRRIGTLRGLAAVLLRRVGGLGLVAHSALPRSGSRPAVGDLVGLPH